MQNFLIIPLLQWKGRSPVDILTNSHVHFNFFPTSILKIHENSNTVLYLQ